MTVVLLIVGLLATAGGFVAIGFGIPNYAFGLGNTLIIAGSVSSATGLILICRYRERVIQRCTPNSFSGIVCPPQAHKVRVTQSPKWIFPV